MIIGLATDIVDYVINSMNLSKLFDRLLFIIELDILLWATWGIVTRPTTMDNVASKRTMYGFGVPFMY